MNQSNIVKLLSVFAFAFIQFGCQKFLDQQPITEIGPEMVFKDVASTRRALAGVYSRLSGDGGYGKVISLYFTVDNDEMKGPTGTQDDRRAIAHYNASTSNTEILNPFKQLFQGIEYANICISNIPKMDMYNNGTEQEKKQLRRMYGEALTLRAQFYFEAIRNWGDLPAQFSPAAESALNEPFPKRVNSEILYDHIIDDLLIAEDLVPWRNDVTSIGDDIDERLTKGAVKALRARISLFRGGYQLHADGSWTRGSNYLHYYQIAKDECSDIINAGQHSLNPSYKSLWKNQVCAHAIVDPNGELMFQVSTIGGGAVSDSKLGYYNGPKAAGNGNSSISILPTYFYMFDSMDVRRDVTCVPYSINDTSMKKTGLSITSMCDGKYRRDWITNPSFLPTDQKQYFGLNWQILRYSDVLLMFAEAENELNGATADAIEKLNMVRRRAHDESPNSPGLYDISVGLSSTEFFKVIVRERALEFGGEGIRKYDLLRWNLMDAAILQTRNNLINLSTPSATTLFNPSYMAAYPSYCLSDSLPTKMYYAITGNNAKADDKSLFVTSFYRKSSSTPSVAIASSCTWLGTSVNTTTQANWATGYTKGKSELLPIPQAVRDANYNMTQNPGY